MTPRTLTLAARQHPSPAPNADPTEQFLQYAGKLADEHALVVAEHGLDLLCGLIRRGCTAATCLRPSAHADEPTYTLVLVPAVTRIAALDPMIHTARHALLPSGRVVIGLAAQRANSRLSVALARRLRLNGFRQIRVQGRPTLTVMQADLPAVERVA